MKIAGVQKLNIDINLLSPEIISGEMDKVQAHKIDTINWQDFSYIPDVQFAIAHNGNVLFLKFFVCEKYFRAEIREPNGNVYEDSCVEFFVSPSDDGIYYNFEFNAKGICLMGSGTGRHNRTRSDKSIISGIRVLPSFKGDTPPMKDGCYLWNLTAAIPSDVFLLHNIKNFSKSRLMANFYKCGDKLEVPHYLSWNPISTASPDFHRPEFFGVLNFQ